MTRKQTSLDRLAQLSTSDLQAVVDVIASAIITGDGWLQRQQGGALRCRTTRDVVITEKPA